MTQQSPDKNLDILVVEDDKPTRMLLEKMIRARGHRVLGCDSAEAAAELLRTNNFPLILLDIQLPGMSGLDFSRELRSHEGGQYFYILVGTANNRAEDLREILDAGADDYIAKPYNPGLLDVRLAVAEAAVADIADRRSLEERLKFLAEHDPLTGLFNRSKLDTSLKRAVDIARSGQPGAVLYLDLDNFKIVNDTLGHETGDRLLLEVSKILRESVRATDMLVRFGGDEFVIILSDCSLDDALEIAGKLRNGIEKMVFAEKEKVFRIGSSIGVVPVDGARESSDVLSLADAACYSAKARGKNRVVLHEEEGGEINRLIADTDWNTRIREAIQDGSLQIWYQPVVAIKEGQIHFHEALLRYVDPRLPEPIAPAAFLNSLQRSGFTMELDRYVISKALTALKQNSQLILSVNISGASLGDDSLCSWVEDELTRLKITPDRLLFEITENEIIPNLEKAATYMKKLQVLGCRFCLDDFGSGFSSLSYLKNLPVDFIKIEGTFVRDLARESFNQSILRSIIILAKAMGARTVAEYVESRETYHLLDSIGVDCAQGHFLGAPRIVPYQDLEIPTSPEFGKKG